MKMRSFGCKLVMAKGIVTTYIHAMSAFQKCEELKIEIHLRVRYAD